MTGDRRKNSRKRPGTGHVTLARALSKHGIASRAQSRVLIDAGRVSVNGTTVRSADRWVDPKTDRIRIDGLPLRRKEFVYLAMHKPAGIVTTRSDEQGRRTVYSLLPKGTPWVFPVGRLDKESSGLLLLTNDTRLGEQLTGPRAMVPKTYEVHLGTPLREPDARTLEAGMTVGGVQYRRARVDTTTSDRTVCRLVLTEGKNREIRRMLAHLGYHIRSLQRVSVGPLQLGRLQEGEVRRLSGTEIRVLMASYAKEDPQ